MCNLRALLREAFRRLGDEPGGDLHPTPARTDEDRARMRQAVLDELARRQRARNEEQEPRP